MIVAVGQNDVSGFSSPVRRRCAPDGQQRKSALSLHRGRTTASVPLELRAKINHTLLGTYKKRKPDRPVEKSVIYSLLRARSQRSRNIRRNIYRRSSGGGPSSTMLCGCRWGVSPHKSPGLGMVLSVRLPFRARLAQQFRNVLMPALAGHIERSKSASVRNRVANIGASINQAAN